MDVQILITEVPWDFERFLREQGFEPVIPEDPLADASLWTHPGNYDVYVAADKYEGKPSFRVNGDLNGYIKFLRALLK